MPRRKVDRTTGQIYRGPDARPPRVLAADWPTPQYGSVYQPVLAQIAEDDALTGADVRLLLRLIAAAPMGECQIVSIDYYAERLHLHRNTVSRSLKTLLDRGMLDRDPKHPRCVWVDVEAFWRGSKSAHSLTRRRLAEARGPGRRAAGG